MEEVRTLARRRDQYLLLRIEEMRDELRVVLHDLGPEVDDLALIVFGLATGELFESPREAGRAHAVLERMTRRDAKAALIPAGGIERFAAACAALDLLVCNDSGVMHIAAALGIATISFHSLGRPAEWAPRSDRAIAFWAPASIGHIPVAPVLEGARVLLGVRDG